MDSHFVSLIIAAAAATLTVLGRLASLTKAWSAAWRTANTPTLEWPVCSACHGYGERRPQEPQCRACAGRGRARPGFFSLFRRALGGLVF